MLNQDLYYLDNAATTVVLAPIRKEMNRLMEEVYGNPSSLHEFGLRAERCLTSSREAMADFLQCHPSQVYFTSGATEANNWALENIWQARKKRGRVLWTTACAHASILEKMHALEKQGATVRFAPLQANGRIDLQRFKEGIKEDSIGFSFLWVNNETGVCQDVSGLIALLREKAPHCMVHFDAVQGFGKLPQVRDQGGIDFLTLSGHKINGPKGVGVMMTRRQLPLVSLLYGGGQEKKVRGGTENVPAIAGLALAAKIRFEHLFENQKHVCGLQQTFEDALQESMPDMVIHGKGSERSPYMTSFSVPGVRGEVLVHALASKNIIVSTGSACSSKKVVRSHVLQAMGVSEALLEGGMRVSFNESFNESQILFVVDQIVQTVKNLRQALQS